MSSYGRLTLSLGHVDDPAYRYCLVYPEAGESYGDDQVKLVGVGLRLRIALMVMHKYQLSLDEAVQWCRKNNPRVEVTALRGKPRVWECEWKHGLRGEQFEMNFVKNIGDVRGNHKSSRPLLRSGRT